MGKPQQHHNRQQSKTAVKVQRQQVSVHSGPLPNPEDLQKYDLIVPGSAERILKMAEEEQNYRHEIERKFAKSSVRMALLGILFAFLSVVVLSFLVYYALHLGFGKEAATIAVGAIAAVASVFIFFRRKKDKAK